jgi:hypothetical protein
MYYFKFQIKKDSFGTKAGLADRNFGQSRNIIGGNP